MELGTGQAVDEAGMVVDKSGNRVKRMFGAIAPKYDRMNHLLSLNIDRYWRWRTVRMLKPVPRQPVLDVCTGTGDLALAFLRQSRGTAPVIGSDFCQEMLEIGRRKGEAGAYPEQIRFVEADAQALPFPNDTFQVVAVAFGLRNVADTDQGLREMTRVCRPGGRVAVLEFSTPQGQPMKTLYGWYFRYILPRIGQYLARNDQEAYEYLPASVGEFLEGEGLAERLRAVGLQDVVYHRFTFGIATLYIGSKAST